MLTALDILKFKALEEIATEQNVLYQGLVVQFFGVWLKKDGSTFLFSIDDALSEAYDERYPNIIDQSTVNKMKPVVSYHENPWTTVNSAQVLELDEFDIRMLYERYELVGPENDTEYTFLSPIESLEHKFYHLNQDEMLAVAYNYHYYYVTAVKAKEEEIHLVSGSALLLGQTPETAKFDDRHLIIATPGEDADFYDETIAQGIRNTYGKSYVEFIFWDQGERPLERSYTIALKKKGS